MSFGASLSDIALVVETAYTIFTRLKEAPEEFLEIKQELRDLSGVLKQIERQSKNPQSALSRNRGHARAIGEIVGTCKQQLHELVAHLDRYDSLGSTQPRKRDLVGYITENFSPIRDKLQQRRSEIDTQLQLCQLDQSAQQTGQLSQILRIVSERVEAERAGERPERITGHCAEDDDVMTVLTEDFRNNDISEDKAGTYKQDILQYLHQVREEEEDDEWCDRTDIAPADSASYIGSSIMPSRTELRPNDSVSYIEEASDRRLERPASASTPSTKRFSTSRGVRIEDISSMSIRNPHLNYRNIKIPGTFDVWKLSSLSWDLQQTLSDGAMVAKLAVAHMEDFEVMQHALASMDPVLLLVVAESSTQDDFWHHMRSLQAPLRRDQDRERQYYRNTPAWFHVFDLHFHEAGAVMVNLLSHIADELTRFGAFVSEQVPARISGHQERESSRQTLELPESVSSSRFGRFAQSIRRSPSKVKGPPSRPRSPDSGALVSESFQWKPFQTGTLTKRVYSRAIQAECSLWPEILIGLSQVLLSTLLGYPAGYWPGPVELPSICREDFEIDLATINLCWQDSHGRQSPDTTLLICWLAEVQGFKPNGPAGRVGIARISRELHFQECGFVDQTVATYRSGAFDDHHMQLSLRGTLPAGWTADITSAGRYHYLEQSTATRTWVLPKAVIEQMEAAATAANRQELEESARRVAEAESPHDEDRPRHSPQMSTTTLDEDKNKNSSSSRQDDGKSESANMEVADILASASGPSSKQQSADRAAVFEKWFNDKSSS